MSDAISQLSARAHDGDPDDEITGHEPLRQRPAVNIEFVSNRGQGDRDHRRTERSQGRGHEHADVKGPGHFLDTGGAGWCSDGVCQ